MRLASHMAYGCTSGADTVRNSADNPCAQCDLEVIWHMAARLVLTLFETTQTIPVPGAICKPYVAARLVLTLFETTQTIPVPGAACKSYGCTSGADTV